ncbi:hypothetical protein HPP92_016358 [Vanilla planifolia]|uniref:Uncharacterized protein n=1 Tax=Vanilla planifolia TaxID=51239 RepID=A0A835QMZ7_VANPL|nr:hypothetical protein HPP92_016358 [Vanilla planifolia]
MLPLKEAQDGDVRLICWNISGWKKDAPDIIIIGRRGKASRSKTRLSYKHVKKTSFHKLEINNSLRYTSFGNGQAFESKNGNIELITIHRINVEAQSGGKHSHNTAYERRHI